VSAGAGWHPDKVRLFHVSEMGECTCSAKVLSKPAHWKPLNAQTLKSVKSRGSSITLNSFRHSSRVRLLEANAGRMFKAVTRVWRSLSAGNEFSAPIFLAAKVVHEILSSAEYAKIKDYIKRRSAMFCFSPARNDCVSFEHLGRWQQRLILEEFCQDVVHGAE
jgi:hypothetical protein